MPFYNLINILFIHIPKTGGTSIENYFYNKYKIKRSIETLFSDFTLLLNNHSLQYSTFNELYENKDYFNIDFDKIKILTVVRNPYYRIISDLFFFNLINIEFTKDQIYEKIIYFLNSNDLIYDNHKIEQYKYLIDSKNEIHKNIIIMKTETLTSDMIINNFNDFNLERCVF